MVVRPTRPLATAIRHLPPAAGPPPWRTARRLRTVQPPFLPAPSMPRRHDIDALRVLAFALLILYHTAMAYVDGWGFHLKSEYTAEWLQWPMLLVNRWRMPLLFLLSGIAIALMRPEAHIARFAVLRTWRLLLPLLFRNVRRGADPALRRGTDQRAYRARLRRLPAALLADAGMAAGHVCRLAAAHHLEPPVVPGLPMGLHTGAGAADAGTGYPCGAPRGGALCPGTGADPDRAAHAALLRLGGLARSPVSLDQPAVRRLVPARQVRHGVPGGLPVCPYHAVLGTRGRTAPDHVVGGGHRGGLVLRHPHPGAGVACRFAAAAMAGERLGAAGDGQPVAVPVGRTADPARLGQGVSGSPVPLAAVLHRGGVSLVPPAPEPDHRAAVLAQAAAFGAVVGAAVGRGRDGGGLPAAARRTDPARWLAAPAVRTAPAAVAADASRRRWRSGGSLETS